jgi:hypothetical protein
MDEEIWLPVKNWEGLYEISSYGRVKSLPKGDGNGNRERILKQGNEPSNTTIYKSVRFSKDGKVTKYIVHRLVAEHFIPNSENKPQINHIDNNGSNNNIENLEWVTGSENMIHAQKQGRLFEAQSKGGQAIGSKKIKHSIKMLEELGVEVLEYMPAANKTRKARADIITKCKHAIKKNVLVEHVKTNQHLLYCDVCRDIITCKKRLQKLEEKQCQLTKIR